MKIVIVHGTQRKGSTYNIAKLFTERLNDTEEEVKEIWLPKDMPNFCRGCFNCILKDESKCPDYEFTKKNLDKLQWGDLIIFTTPVYVYHCSGQMKAFLDHFPFQWMVHRPNSSMFKKKALIISTAAGGGTKSAMKDIEDSMTYWGISKTYKFGFNVRASSWKQVSEENNRKIINKVNKLCEKIQREKNKTKSGLKTKLMFNGIRLFYKKGKFTGVDGEYWKKQGWDKKERPWR